MQVPVIIEISARYDDAAEKECINLRARIKSMEHDIDEMNTQLDTRSSEISSLRTQNEEYTVYKHKCEELIERFKHAQAQCENQRRIAETYKSRIEQIQGIVNP